LITIILGRSDIFTFAAGVSKISGSELHQYWSDLAGAYSFKVATSLVLLE
jgi:hypothetical protein